jgi:tetratricopeptide (TPR) repeat protein
MFSRDDETAALLRNATAHADVLDWDAALDCLRQAKKQMIESPAHYPVETWCKLALYLSRAGRFEESMREFDWLIADLPRRARRESFMDDPSVSFGKTRKKTIYNGMIRHGKRGIEEKRAVAMRRMNKVVVS